MGIDLRAVQGHGIEGHRLDLVTADLTDVFEGADAVVHLATVFGPKLEGPEIEDAVDVTMARRVLDAADKAGLTTVVLLSSATVYGPWPNNAVPLTEDAPLRPTGAGLCPCSSVRSRRLAPTGAPATRRGRGRLRPATTVGGRGWLAEALDAAERPARG